MSRAVKYLGVILDRKLNWNRQYILNDVSTPREHCRLYTCPIEIQVKYKVVKSNHYAVDERLIGYGTSME